MNITIQHNTQAQCIAKCKALRFTQGETAAACRKLESLTGERSPFELEKEQRFKALDESFKALVGNGILKEEHKKGFFLAFNSKTGMLKSKAPSAFNQPIANLVHVATMQRNNPFKVSMHAIMRTDFFGSDEERQIMSELLDNPQLLPSDVDGDANCLKQIFPEDFPA